MGKNPIPVFVNPNSMESAAAPSLGAQTEFERARRSAMRNVSSNRSRLKYWQPASELANYITGYHLYDTHGAPGERFTDVLLPAWANIRVSLDGEPWSVRLGRRTFFPEQSSIFGPASHAGYVDFGRGTLVGFGITPIGWACLFDANAQEFANKVSPLDQLLGAEAATLSAALVAGGDPPAVFDHWLIDRLAQCQPEAESIGRLFELIADPQIATVATLVERISLSERRLIRLCQRHFGFGPKSLLRRGRFLRALINIQTLKRGEWARAAADAGYHDQSHFLRDCHLFLDMSLSDFLRLPKPMAEASFQLRTEMHGAPIQGLHDISYDGKAAPGPSGELTGQV